MNIKNKMLSKEEELKDYEKNILKQIELAESDERNFSNLKPLDIAKKYFGFNGFKDNGQEEIINYILEKKGDVLGIIATGGGKSACFQIPALIQKNMTIVVSPLIALMKDQVENLVKKGINSAFFINSSIQDNVKDKIISLILKNKVKILYLAPESLQSEKIQSILSEIKIDLFVIDEAHCISTWGHNFRPDYLKLSKVIKNLSSPQLLALTATATPKVISDINKQLNRKFKIFKASFDRPMLYLVVENVPDSVKKEIYLLDLMNILKGPTIIYVRTIELLENLSHYLNKNGFNCMCYHSKLKPEEKNIRQNSFMNGECDIIIATIAFGMGIDKKDIRNIIHYNIPQSIEGYYQEIGRAGRDGNKSNCILLFTESDIYRIKTLISSDWPDKTKIQNLIDYFKKKSTNLIFTSSRSLEYEIDIKEIPIRLILHRLEESKAIKRYPRVLHQFKIKFNKSSQDIINLSNKEYIDDLKKIFASEHFKHFKTIVNFEMLIDNTNLNYFRILEIFRYLKSKGYIEIDKERNKDLIYLNENLESFEITPLDYQFREILENNYNKVDELVQCINTNKCIRKKVLEYFDEHNLKENCGMCSNCLEFKEINEITIEINENYATDDEIEVLSNIELDITNEELYISLLKIIAIDKRIPKKDFIKILKGNLHRFSAKWKFELESYKLFEGEDESTIEETLNQLISDSLVEITNDGELRITKKGINHLEK